MTRPFRVPGPLGSSPGAGGGRLPGPLHYGDGSSSSAPPTKAAPGKRRGISVNPASEITGAEWARMVKASTDLPDFIEDQLGWSNGSLTTPEKFKVPKDTREREWLPDYLAAFAGGEWELSTCHLEVSAQGDSSNQRITAVVVPHLSKDEQLGRATPLKDSWHDFKDVVITFGWTFPTFHKPSQTGALLKSLRGLVLVANRVVLTLGTAVQTLKVEEPQMVATLLHEIAVHAGRGTRHLPDLHGDETVERLTKEINEEFKKPGENSVKYRSYDLIEQFYKKGQGKP